ncbi:beta-glucosidase BglX [Panacibacter sp. DH6]|uniref:Periplasmic beta-glucosidase n=1 Tax=Panacibacter microcysteis TaxID=2793269 RepID=A0A931E7R4_9BACT|nr:beta-glucosidase BglX [Panacibacter microcysteis]MBG9375301.1 beta-glucosidase BglX [Panacibacter microcysteis]
MKRLIAALFTLVTFYSYAQQDAKMNTFINNLMSRMTIEEKIGQLNLVTPGGAVTGSVVSKGVDENIRKGYVGGLFGITGPEKVRQAQEIAVKNSRLKIPLFFGLDVIHGHKTVFPIPLGLSCSWDIALIERSARIAATEATADGLCWAFSPMVDIARDPRWGRISEGSGEDQYLGGEIAKAMVRGYQGKDYTSADRLMACVKHFALYGAAEAGRDYNSVDMSKIKMYEYYLPPYKAAVDAGVGSVMSSFNDIDAVPATGNKWLLTDLLRKQWGFKGLVVSDYTSVSEMSNHGLGDLKTVSALALNAGLDMDMVAEGFLTTLKQSLKEGKVTQKQIDDACRRILEAKYKLGLFDDPYRFMDDTRPAKEILTAETRKAAREIAAHSFVLLKNNAQVLPLKKSGTIAVVGPLADSRRNMLGTWSVAGDFTKAVTVIEGIKNVAPDAAIIYAKGANISDDPMLVKRTNVFPPDEIETDKRSPEVMIKEAVEAANNADVVVAVVGEAADMTGEASSRSDIGLPESQLNLLKALATTGKPVVMVLFNGRPMTLTWETQHINAILDVWFGGTEGGNAIADVLFGNYNPSGKLTTTFPQHVGQIPLYYNHKHTGRPYNNEDFAKFKSNYLDISNDPLFPFGYGLSYTTFAYSEVKVSKEKLKGSESLKASVTLTNTGKYAGEEVVQLYITDVVASVTRAVKDLKGFQKILLQPGESREVDFTITPEQLKFYNNNLKYDWESGDFVIHIGTNSSDLKSAKINWVK